MRTDIIGGQQSPEPPSKAVLGDWGGGGGGELRKLLLIERV